MSVMETKYAIRRALLAEPGSKIALFLAYREDGEMHLNSVDAVFERTVITRQKINAKAPDYIGTYCREDSEKDIKSAVKAALIAAA